MHLLANYLVMMIPVDLPTMCNNKNFSVHLF